MILNAVALISEGYGRLAKLDKRHFYRIALGSTRECRTLLILAEREEAELMGMFDHAS
jgi:four helix bundle protein